MKKLTFSILFLLTACAGDAWTDGRLQTAISSCKGELLVAPARATDQQATDYCTCYYNAVKLRWNYTQYTTNPDQIDQQLDTEGQLRACENAAF